MGLSIMTAYAGPAFRLVDTITLDRFQRQGGLASLARPLLVKGGVTGWPAWEKWSFDWFARLARESRHEVKATFQNGLIEQGATQRPLELPLEPYVRQLGEAAPATGSLHRDDVGLCPDRVLAALGRSDSFRLDWGYLGTFQPNKVYLGQWDILREFPQLRQDVDLSRMWRKRTHWPYIWIGPEHTVTGLHTDYPDNWFCHFRGEKEFVMFLPDNDRWLSLSPKYDYGAKLSRVDVMQVAKDGPEARLFAQAEGIYARVQAGDALFVPKNTWHCVLGLQPSISLSVFGLSLGELIAEGPKRIALDLLHRIGLYRRGNCTCHGAKPGRYA
jgi:lysine-specific demethylase 8